jgi:hypothetical protein
VKRAVFGLGESSSFMLVQFQLMLRVIRLLFLSFTDISFLYLLSSFPSVEGVC